MRIGFLYPYHEYHVFHSAPSAFELSRLEPDLEVYLLSSSKNSSDLLHQLGNLYPGHRCIHYDLSQPWNFRYLNVGRRRFPSPRIMIRRHANLLKEMNVIVGTNHPIVSTLHDAGITGPKLIMAFHGAGDRAYGFSRRLEKFDLLLLSGKKKYNRLKRSRLLRRDNWAIVGYPKFDVVQESERTGNSLFPEDRPVVLYNPHFRRHLSSWYQWGRQVMDFFVSSPRYNLIFAPHVELKGRKQKRLLLRKYRNHPHIHIDLGSPASINMTYTNMASIYLGDASGQVGEFLRHPRPCLFLNTHGVNWKSNPDYLHWSLGPVIDTPGQLEEALAESVKYHGRYSPLQIQYFRDSFELNEEPSGLRAARAIQSFISKSFNS